ncbi:unnamed protein product, partial [Prunus brigantina]
INLEVIEKQRKITEHHSRSEHGSVRERSLPVNHIELSEPQPY